MHVGLVDERFTNNNMRLYRSIRSYSKCTLFLDDYGLKFFLSHGWSEGWIAEVTHRVDGPGCQATVLLVTMSVGRIKETWESTLIWANSLNLPAKHYFIEWRALLCLVTSTLAMERLSMQALELVFDDNPHYCRKKNKIQVDRTTPRTTVLRIRGQFLMVRLPNGKCGEKPGIGQSGDCPTICQSFARICSCSFNYGGFQGSEVSPVYQEMY